VQLFGFYYKKKSTFGQVEVMISEATKWPSRQELGKIKFAVKHST
jgi:hypothetical protein